VIRLTASWSGGSSPLDTFNLSKALIEWADEVGPAIRTQLKEKTPVYQAPAADPLPAPGGRMRDSETYTRSSGAAAVTMNFVAHVPYARYVVRPTVPHEIHAVAARYLHYYDDVAEHFARRVLHPGTAGNPFPRLVLDDMHDEIISNLRSRISEQLHSS
jgi:hypothetical protein